MQAAHLLIHVSRSHAAYLLSRNHVLGFYTDGPWQSQVKIRTWGTRESPSLPGSLPIIPGFLAYYCQLVCPEAGGEANAGVAAKTGANILVVSVPVYVAISGALPSSSPWRPFINI